MITLQMHKLIIEGAGKTEGRQNIKKTISAPIYSLQAIIQARNGQKHTRQSVINTLNSSTRDGCFNFIIAWASICRIRSLVTAKHFPTSSKV